MRVELSVDEARIVESCLSKIQAISGGLDRTGGMTAGEMDFLDSIKAKIRRAYTGQVEATEAFEKIHRRVGRPKGSKNKPVETNQPVETNHGEEAG